jgi:hypothetical protein
MNVQVVQERAERVVPNWSREDTILVADVVTASSVGSSTGKRPATPSTG